MPIYQITYSPKFKRANLYNWGCNFRCKGCSYKLKQPYKAGTPFLSIKEIEKVLLNLDVDKVHFLGGEPTINPDLPKLAHFAHEELKAYTKIGHSNGSLMPPENIDAISISIKAYTNAVHIDYTEVSNASVLKNFAKMYDLGIEIDASSVLIPEYIDCDEIEKIARFIAEIDPNIPYHIIGYVPVPGAPWREPTYQEIEHAAHIAKKYLSRVTFSRLTPDEFLNIRNIDPRYKSIRVA
jgi:pyruvate formate lyase activating enzyme